MKNKKLSILLIFLLPLIVSWSLFENEVKVEVKTANTDRPTQQQKKLGMVSTAVEMNSSLKNVKVVIDKGNINVSFDYPDQTWWLIEHPDRVKGQSVVPYETAPVTFTAVILDKNGRSLGTIKTQRKAYIPEKIKGLIEQKNKMYFKKAYRVPIIAIKKTGNIVTFPINTQTSSHTKKIEFGFALKGVKYKNLFLRFRDGLAKNQCLYEGKVYSKGKHVTDYHGNCIFPSHGWDLKKIKITGKTISYNASKETIKAIKHSKKVLCGSVAILEKKNRCCLDDGNVPMPKDGSIKKNKTTGVCESSNSGKKVYGKGGLTKMKRRRVYALNDNECFNAYSGKNEVVQFESNVKRNKRGECKCNYVYPQYRKGKNTIFCP